MEMEEMQQVVDDYIRQFKVGYFSPLAMMARVTEEVGELAREINHYYGEKQKKSSEDEKEIEEELADVLFIIITMANSLDIDLTEAFEQTMRKFETRDKYRFERVDEETSE
ncbi:NTP pyrophosphatase, house-cleaning of non-canonical NTPs [Atopostipes suicloacalis DSM 15692]|uniref:NTP pyrophosphatase, house-cleaning of non-canonical NTPs n=2 Tax=Atopostipes suicloacalis TaxID=180295 RepID=A0A1M4UTC7_9LACT|nr:NTP pyrophosphatase, house-cleaning of non-canonical NTPs [Atopostipes suicloacalis DSM 15692]